MNVSNNLNLLILIKHLSAFWLGALKDNSITLRIRTALGGSKDSGTGTLVVNSQPKLHMDCSIIPQEEHEFLYNYWSKKIWRCFQWTLNRPNTITLVASGESPKVKLESFKNVDAVALFTVLHASRSMTASAYFNYVALASTSKVAILDKANQPIFSNEGIKYDRLKNQIGTRHLKESDILANRPIIPSIIVPDFAKLLHLDHAEASYHFTGDEQILISDSNSTATVYVDSFAVSLVPISLQDGLFYALE